MNASCIKDLAMILSSNVSVINILPPPYLGCSGMNSIYRKRKKAGGDFTSRDNLSLVFASYQQTQNISSGIGRVNYKERK